MELELTAAPPKAKKRRAATKRKTATTRKKPAAKKEPVAARKKVAPVRKKVAPTRKKAAPELSLPKGPVEELKAWRLKEARRRRVPAFRILKDQVIEALASARPTDEASLLRVPGMGPALVQKHGAAILEILGSKKARNSS